MKILIICGPKLGDVVVRVPIIETLKENGFDVYVLQENWCDIGKYFLTRYNILPNNKIITINSKNKVDLTKFILKNFKKFDYVFLTNPATNKTIFLSKILFPKKAPIFNESWDYENVVEGDRLLLEKLLKRKINYKLKDFAYVINKNELKISSMVKDIVDGNNYLCIFFGQWHRSFREDVWRGLFKYFSKKYEKIVIIGGSDTSWFNMSLESFDNIIDLRNKTSLDESIYLIKNCDKFFTANSGLMWISILLGVKTIAFHGLSRYIWQYDDENVVNLRFWDYKNCIGYPCDTPCVYGDYRCIKSIQLNEIINSIENIM